MRTTLTLLAAAVAVVGCETNQKPDPAKSTPQPVPLRTPGPTTITAAPLKNSAPPQGRLVEIITQPQLARRPNTAAGGASGGPSGGASAGIAQRPTEAARPADVPPPRLTLNGFNRVDASVSCGPLVRLLAMKLNHIPYSGFAGYGALDFVPKLPEGTDPDAMSDDVLGRDAGGTATAVKRLTDGEVDLILVPRLPTDAERAAATAKKIQLRADLVATEALVFTVNAANPVSDLSREQLAKVFSGQAKQWKDLGDAVPPPRPIAAEPITVAYRARGTGSEELLRQLLLQGKPMPELPVSRALSASKLVLDASVDDPQTIGFSVFAYASNMKRDGRVKVLAVDGVVPEPTRVASGQYPLTTPVYVLTRADLGAETELYKLRTWLGGMSGQKVLAEAGYMPTSSEAWTAVRLMGN